MTYCGARHHPADLEVVTSLLGSSGDGEETGLGRAVARPAMLNGSEGLGPEQILGHEPYAEHAGRVI